VVEAVIYRFRTVIAWRDLPASFGPWQTVWKRHHRFSTDGTWGKIRARLLAEADAAGEACARSRRIIRSDARVEGCRPRSTSSSTAAADRW
jgi:transposase